MIVAVACQCGSSDTLVRAKLSKFGYKDAMNIPVIKGREKSKSKLNTLPQFPEVNEIRAHIEGHSKWAIIIGYNDEMMKWADLANGSYLVSDVNMELIIKTFA